MKETVSMLVKKTSEAGFREQFELYQLSLKEEKEREEERKRVEWVGKHKENVAATGDKSAELQAYVRQHFDQQRQLLNCRGQKDTCGGGC